MVDRRPGFLAGGGVGSDPQHVAVKIDPPTSRRDEHVVGADRRAVIRRPHRHAGGLGDEVGEQLVVPGDAVLDDDEGNSRRRGQRAEQRAQRLKAACGGADHGDRRGRRIGVRRVRGHEGAGTVSDFPDHAVERRSKPSMAA